MTVISFMARTVRHRWPGVQFQFVGHLRGPVDLLVDLDRRGNLPLYEQLERSLRDAIRDGRLQAGTRLPSSRALAAELGMSRGVVTSAYEQLAAEGYLETKQGAPVRVARGVRAQPPRPPTASLRGKFAYDFSPGLPDLAGFPRDRWLRALRSAWRETALDAVGYGDPRGVPELREALADYLGRVRGAAADPEHLIVCKAVFNRPKDWVDIDSILAGNVEIDAAERLRWVARIAGDDDPRYNRIVAVLTRR